MIQLSRSLYMCSKDFKAMRIVRVRAQCNFLSEFTKVKSKVDEVSATDTKKASKNLENNNENFESGTITIHERKPVESEIRITHNTDGRGLMNNYENNYSYGLDISKLNSNYSVTQAVQVFKHITSSKSRPINLIKALSKKICLSNNVLQLTQCSDLFYSAATLSFKDIELLNKISRDVLYSKSNFKCPSLSAAILQSCGILKYRNCELIDCLLKIALEDQSENRNKFLFTGLMTLASVNYSSSYVAVILNELAKLKVTDFVNTKAYIDFVWACVMLNQYLPEHISTVLSENFTKQLKVVNDSIFNLEASFMKLMNINGAATHLINFYSGPFLNDDTFKPVFSKAKLSFLAAVVDGLSHIFPKNGYLDLKIDTGAGFLLDVVCYLDFKGNPIQKKKKEGVKVGILLLGFNDVCLGEDNIETGLTCFKQKILEATDYKVIKILHSEYKAQAKLHEKVRYLRENLNNVVKR